MNSEHNTHSLTHTHHTYHHCTPEGRQSIKEGDHRGGEITGIWTIYPYGNNSEPEGPGPEEFIAKALK